MRCSGGPAWIRRLAQQQTGQTLQTTTLVHEAYIRLVDSGQGKQWALSMGGHGRLAKEKTAPSPIRTTGLHCRISPFVWKAR